MASDILRAFSKFGVTLAFEAPDWEIAQLDTGALWSMNWCRVLAHGSKVVTQRVLGPVGDSRVRCQLRELWKKLMPVASDYVISDSRPTRPEVSYNSVAKYSCTVNIGLKTVV